jgi:hypothetical protein
LTIGPEFHYLEILGIELVMRQIRTIATIFALGLLLVSPVAWGCEATGMESCAMSDCPMTDQLEADACHESEALSDQALSGCDAMPEAWIACCDAPVDQDPARVDAAMSWYQTTTPLIILAERVEPRPPSGPPDFISETISSRQHELGRFTLLSSFLL